jgi:hypothetical protein
MRKLIVALVATCLMSLAVVSPLLPAPIPAYAQELLQVIPDLSGVNIYFSELYQEASQFDRASTGISRFAGLLRLAGANLFTLEWRKGIPQDADLIVIAGPATDILPENVARLWAYLQRGGRVLLAVDAFDARGAINRALPARGLFELTWADLGLQARVDVVVKLDGTRPLDVVELDRNGVETFRFSGDAPILNPSFYTRRVNPAHPITEGLVSLLSAGDESVPANLYSIFVSGARSLQIDGSVQDFSVTPLLFTDDPTLYGETDFARYQTNGYSEYNIGTDTTLGSEMILAAAYASTRTNGRLILLGDADLLRNGTGFVTSPAYSGAFVHPMNVQFMLRSVSWLVDRPLTLVDLPLPAPTATATITPTPTPTPTLEPTPGS